MWNVPHLPCSPCPINAGWTGEYANVMLKIDPIESWTRTDFQGEKWDWLRDSCSKDDYPSFLSGLIGAGARKFHNLLRFYVHCSIDLDFHIAGDQTPSGLMGIVAPVCNFMRTILMNEDLDSRVFVWLCNGTASKTLFCHEILYNPHIPLDLLMSVNRSFRMTFADRLFEENWRRFPFRFEMERRSIPAWKIPLARGFLVRGPEMAMAMRDEDHSALIDVIARCETWEEYEMMTMVSSSSALRLRKRVFGGRWSEAGRRPRAGFRRSWMLDDRIIGASVFFHDAYHLARSDRDPADIAHISPSNGTWMKDPEAGEMMDLAGVIAVSDADVEMMSVHQFLKGSPPGAWESLKTVLNEDWFIREIHPDRKISEMVDWIVENGNVALGIGILFTVAGMFRGSKPLTLAIAEMKRVGAWEEWSAPLREHMPGTFAKMSTHHYNLEMIDEIHRRFGSLDSIIDLNEFIEFVFEGEIPEKIICYHGTSDHRYKNGFPGVDCPSIREVGIIPPSRMGTSGYEERGTDLDIVFAASNPTVSIFYSFRSVGQDADMGISSKPIILEIEVETDDVTRRSFVTEWYYPPAGEEVTLAEAICGFPLRHSDKTEGPPSHIVITRGEIGPSCLLRVIELPEDEGAAAEVLDVRDSPNGLRPKFSPFP